MNTTVEKKTAVKNGVSRMAFAVLSMLLEFAIEYFHVTESFGHWKDMP